MGHPIVFVSARAKATREKIKRLLQIQSYNRHELAAALNVSQFTARSYIKALHEAGDIHLAEWRSWHTDTFMIACYAWGAGEDAPKPPYQGEVVIKRYRDKVKADPVALERKRRNDRERRSAAERAADYQRWKDENPEAYQAKTQELADRRREARQLRMLEQAEADRERARIEALRAARRAAKNVPEYFRERFVKVQSLINNPRPDPLVGLFFGMKA